ncbi:MAG: DUF429 domain-containing protein [Acidimicrobiales bacterium]
MSGRPARSGETEPVGTAIGIDGCLGGWLTVEWSTEGISANRVTDLKPLLNRLRAGQVAALAIDMPIGLLDRQPRACDTEARRLLGPRRSSIFPTPVRATLEATDYADACRLSRQCSGKALSIQAFNLLPKIAELDRLVVPADQDRLVEAHPECAFRRLADGPLAHAKRTEEGRQQRIDLLSQYDSALGQMVTEEIASSRRLPVLDLIDATVLAITARRVIEGTEHRLGDDVDELGLAAQIVY